MCAIFGCHQRNNKNFRSDRILGGQSDTVDSYELCAECIEEKGINQ
jgi:hypothetical protein